MLNVSHRSDGTSITRCKAANQGRAIVTNLASLMFMSQGKVSKICEDCHDALSGKVK